MEMQQENTYRRQNSRLFQSYRAVGMITDDIPIILQSMGKETFAVVSLGFSFVIYKVDTLIPALVSPQLPYRILAIESLGSKHLTFTACGRDIFVWKRIEHIHTLKGHFYDIKQLLIVGQVLFSMDEGRNIRLWDLKAMEFIEELKFPNTFTPSIMMHPMTYLNKILIGSEQGSMELWNIRSMKCIYRFKDIRQASIGIDAQNIKQTSTSNSKKRKTSPPAIITCIEQSPAVDVVAVGFSTGEIVLHHLQYDVQVMSFHQQNQPVTTLSFRTDALATTAPFLLSGGANGNIAIWDLNTKRLDTILQEAHEEGPIATLICLPNEPLFLTSARDNAMKLWIFDPITHVARVLKFRSGHCAPPRSISYYGNNTLGSITEGADGTCCQILSAGGHGDSSFRVFHTGREQQSCELSQRQRLKGNARKYEGRLPPITSFAAMETRDGDWSNIVTCHERTNEAYVWSFDRRAIGKHVLSQDNATAANSFTRVMNNGQIPSPTAATCTTISSCGNFAIIGSVGGAIFKYNLQSGLKRGSFPLAATPRPALIEGLLLPGSSQAEEYKAAEEAYKRTIRDQHQGPVTSVVVDALNKQLVSAGSDGKIKFWDFVSHHFLYEITIKPGASITSMKCHKDSNLLAVTCDTDHAIRLVDLHARIIVRRFVGHTHRLTDMTFSPDGRWVITTAADATLRVWDIPTGKCVDWLKFEHIITSVTISPTSEFFATTHVDQLGIYIWANRQYYMDVLLDSEPKHPIMMDLPVCIQETEIDGSIEFSNYNTKDMADNVISTGEQEDEMAEITQNEPLQDGLVTLSNAPRAFWQSLFHLELIKKRNKPISPPKAPEKAPFFLTTVRKEDGVQPTFEAVDKAQMNAKKQKRIEKDEEPKENEILEGWGVGSDDESWGSDGNEDNESNSGEPSKLDEPSASRIRKTTSMVASRCRLAVLLAEAMEVKVDDIKTLANKTKFHAVLDYLQSLSASSVDVEINTMCMGSFDEDGKQILQYFLIFIAEEMNTRRNFQVLQAYLNRFLKVHEDILTIPNSPLWDQLQSVLQVQQNQWEHLQQLLHNSLCLVQYFSKIQM